MKRHHLISLLFVAACGGGKSPEPAKPAPEPTTQGSATPEAGSAVAETPPPPPEPAPPPPPPPKPHEDTFIKLTKEEKTKIMKEKVVPAMAKAFKAHDAKKFAKFDCKTCHGKAKDMKMPNPDLPKLDFAALQSGKLEPKVMAMAKFMGEVVTPEMATILGLEKFDPQKPELGGFGCLTCHVMKQ